MHKDKVELSQVESSRDMHKVESGRVKILQVLLMAYIVGSSRDRVEFHKLVENSPVLFDLNRIE